MYVQMVVFKHCEKLFKWIEKGDVIFTKLTLAPHAHHPRPPTLPLLWALKTGGLKDDGGDILSSCQGYKIMSC